jgi:predicted nucleotidyltransferase
MHDTTDLDIIKDLVITTIPAAKSIFLFGSYAKGQYSSGKKRY